MKAISIRTKFSLDLYATHKDYSQNGAPVDKNWAISQIKLANKMRNPQPDQKKLHNRLSQIIWLKWTSEYGREMKKKKRAHRGKNFI